MADVMDSTTINRITPMVDTESLRATVDLVALIGRYTKLQKRGSVYVGLCPFHTEKTPSFYVYPDRRYHCFGCGAHGDCVDFVKATDGGDFKEAVARLGAGKVSGASYRKIIQNRREAAVATLDLDLAQFPWKHLEAEWQAEQDNDLAKWRDENRTQLSGFELWVLTRWLAEIRSEAFRETVEFELLRAQWEREG